MALDPIQQATLAEDMVIQPTQRSQKNKSIYTTSVDEPTNLGKSLKLPVPNFNDPNRPSTCLEVDFPIVPINRLARQEGNAGKPIYQMSKWWARRRSSVFRAMLIAAATQAPDDPTTAAKRVWEAYYANVQKGGSFSHLRVLDPFMGGGTTLVEGARLGMHMTGVDLNPVAWFVTKNELASSDPEQVSELFEEIETQVKPQVQPFYVTTCPRGHHGKWIDSRTGQVSEVDPISLKPSERLPYRWQGPEVIYTFWAKHGPCPASGCGHRTPIFRTPVIAEKKLSTAYFPLTCPACRLSFHAELGETRMAPDATRVVLPSEPQFSEISQHFAQMFKDYTKGSKTERYARIRSLLQMAPHESGLHCPVCDTFAGETIIAVLHKHSQPSTPASQIKKTDFHIERKSVYMYLLVHPKWLKGSPGEEHEVLLGGYAGASPDQTQLWFSERLKGLTFIEVRGHVRLADEGLLSSVIEMASISSSDLNRLPTQDAVADESDGVEDTNAAEAGADRKQYGLPAEIILADGTRILTRQGNVPAQSTFTCQACGRQSDLLAGVRASGHTAPVSVYALQCYCPECETEGYNYGGRYFKAPDANDMRRVVAADSEWAERSANDLARYWPCEKLPYAWMTHHLNGGIPNWGYTHWWSMFNSRQMLIHTQLLRAITEAPSERWPLDVREQALGALQQYLRNQNMFAFWNIAADKLEPMFANPHYHPKSLIIENAAFSNLGRGTWISAAETVRAGLDWCRSPWESFVPVMAQKGVKFEVGDSLNPSKQRTLVSSATELPIESHTLDLVITDPPFGDNVFYADLADFFYVWLRIPMLRWYAGKLEANQFRATHTPRALEAITNRAEHPDTRSESEKQLGVRPPADEFYQQTLTASWREAYRTLKPGGLLAFTFHHSADEPWVNVLASLFDAGFILVATYPIRSDESKGESGQFGSRKIEYDIIHVCRKRTEEPAAVSWARMRTWVKDEVANLRRMLELYRDEQLAEADIRVILRGKALEYYSRHYGQVLTGAHEPLSIRDALIGINQLLEDTSESGGFTPPESAHPVTRLFLIVFHGRTSLNRDDLSKFLRGNIVPPEEFLGRGWAIEAHKTVRVLTIPERFRELRKPGRRRDTISFDLDQAHFLIGAALPGSGVDIQRELSEQTMKLHPSVEPLLKWYGETSEDSAIREAAARAQRLVNAWRDERKRSSGPRQGQLFEDDLEYDTGVQVNE